MGRRRVDAGATEDDLGSKSTTGLPMTRVGPGEFLQIVPFVRRDADRPRELAALRAYAATTWTLSPPWRVARGRTSQKRGVWYPPPVMSATPTGSD